MRVLKITYICNSVPTSTSYSILLHDGCVKVNVDFMALKQRHLLITVARLLSLVGIWCCRFATE